MNTTENAIYSSKDNATDSLLCSISQYDFQLISNENETLENIQNQNQLITNSLKTTSCQTVRFSQ